MQIRQTLVMILLVVIMSSGYLFNLYGDWLWYNSVGYPDVFSAAVFGSLMLGFMTGAGFLLFSVLNLYIARRRAAGKRKHLNDSFLFVVAAFLSIIIGASFSDWLVWFRFLNPTQFGTPDPVFGLDIGFYVFTVPFYGFILSYLAACVVLTGILVAASYALNSGEKGKRLVASGAEFIEGGFEVSPVSIDLTLLKKKLTPHLSILLGLFMLLLSFAFVMAQWGLLYSETGIVSGAGFTDLSVMLYVYSIASIISIALAIMFFINTRLKRWRLLMEGSLALVGILVIGTMVAGITQGFIVSPDEFNIEKPYIERNIHYTLSAYGLDDIEEDIFPVKYNLSLSDIEFNTGTIDNIRLWDWRPLTKTYNQLQLFRTYYDFNDVDIDRYLLDGSYKEVMVSAREIDTMELPANARTWVNEHLVYTHGYGVVMNPVDKVTSEGLPEFYIQDIPPKSEFSELALERPEIYYGEDTWNYIVTKTTTEEFDYPSGQQNIYTTHDIDAGVQLSGILTRLTYAVKFGSIELLFSNSITPESRIMFTGISKQGSQR